MLKAVLSILIIIAVSPFLLTLGIVGGSVFGIYYLTYFFYHKLADTIKKYRHSY